jgi:hypothetical protein
MMRISNVTMVDVPQPLLVPEYVEAEREVADVEGDLPHVLAELSEGGRLILAAAQPEPALHLTL